MLQVRCFVMGLPAGSNPAGSSFEARSMQESRAAPNHERAVGFDRDCRVALLTFLIGSRVEETEARIIRKYPNSLRPL